MMVMPARTTIVVAYYMYMIMDMIDLSVVFHCSTSFSFTAFYGFLRTRALGQDVACRTARSATACAAAGSAPCGRITTTKRTRTRSEGANSKSEEEDEQLIHLRHTALRPSIYTVACTAVQLSHLTTDLTSHMAPSRMAMLQVHASA